MIKSAAKSLAALAMLFVLPAAQAGVVSIGSLYGVDSGRALFSIDVATGGKTAMGMVSANAGTIGGLAYDPVSNTVFLTSSSTDSLYTLDLATGNATLVGAYGSDVVMHGLEWDGSTGTLYGASSTPNSFYKISAATGVATLVSSIGFTTFNNLGYDSTNDVMYMTNSTTESLYTVNRDSGAVTLVGALLGPTNPNGLAYAADLRTMFMVDNNTDTLYTLNLNSGAAVTVGSTGSGNLLGLVYVAATPEQAIPEPATYALIGLALTGLAWQRRRAAPAG